MIKPPPSDTICGATACNMKKSPLTLTLRTASQSDSAKSRETSHLSKRSVAVLVVHGVEFSSCRASCMQILNANKTP